MDDKQNDVALKASYWIEFLDIVAAALHRDGFSGAAHFVGVASLDIGEACSGTAQPDGEFMVLPS